jgi:anti-anti-sigma factor
MFRPPEMNTTAHTTPPIAVAGGAIEAEALPVCTTSISIRRYSDWSAVMLRGELDRQSVAEIRATVAMELAEHRPVMIELVGVALSDVDGIRALAELVKSADGLSGGPAVEVHGAQGQVARLIQLLKLDDLLMAGDPPDG